MGADGLGVGEVALFDGARGLLGRAVIRHIEHVLHVLGMVLRLVLVELLLVGQLDRACPVEELRRTVLTHVLELGCVDRACSLATAYAPGARSCLHAIVRKDLAVEEGEVVGAGPIEALVRVCVARELVDEVLRVLGTGQELIATPLSPGERLRPSQVVDQLAATTRTLVPLLQLFLHHVFGLGASTHQLRALRLRPADLSARTVWLAVHVVRAWLSLAGWLHFDELLLVCQRV